ncbi:uncharacterized protein BKA55DRAFT_533505 [Fusarium redolens]|uniref:Uncharacterized protein n=1 Tax=Fusarium redolens TaxID=48865 RepID=A0A9P9KQL2_FUSRE|nr:uncharacterized protein BKA55DRAFT_533505 [Fusarium redolens]KAH7266698.1 hypothetical protein BKA55DRAFT_533505 [Fusarium redolens]
MEDTYNTSKREKEEDGNGKGILGRWCWNGCRGAVGEAELGGRARGGLSLGGFWGFGGEEKWGRVCVFVCVCGGGEIRHLMSCSKVQTIDEDDESDMVMISLEEESKEIREDLGRYGHQKGGSSGCVRLLQRTPSYSYSTDVSTGSSIGWNNILSTAIVLSRQNSSPSTRSLLASSVNNPRIYCMRMDEIVDLGNRQICR